MLSTYYTVRSKRNKEYGILLSIYCNCQFRSTNKILSRQLDTIDDILRIVNNIIKMKESVQ